MIKLTTTQAHAAELRRHRVAVAAQIADAIETLLPGLCSHQNRKSCPVCAERRTVQAAARTVRETGGVT